MTSADELERLYAEMDRTAAEVIAARLRAGLPIDTDGDPGLSRGDWAGTDDLLGLDAAVDEQD